MPKVEGTVTTPGDTNNRLDPDHVLVTFTPEKGEPITVEYYYNKNSYQHPSDFANLHKRVTVKYSDENPHIHTIYEETKGDYTKYIAAVLIAGMFAWFFGEGVKGFIIIFVIIAVVTLIIIELNARLSWLNFNSKREEE